MKRLIALVLLIGVFTVLTACDPIDELNAVVNNFWEQWKAGNAANMLDLMTEEIEYALLIPDGTSSTSLTLPPAAKGVPASTIVDMLIASSFQDVATLSITSTETYGKYGIVTCLFSLNSDPSDKVEFVFHLNDTDDGWKINFVGVKDIIYP